MSTGSKLIGDCLVKGDYFVNTVRPNSNNAPTVEINDGTTAERTAMPFTGASLFYDNQTGQLYFLPPALAPDVQLTNQVNQSIPQRRVIGRGGASGTGAPEVMTLSNQFNVTGLAIDLIQPVNLLNTTPAVLVYQIQNDSQLTSTSNLVETTIKSLVIQAATLAGAIDDNVLGNFGGSFTIAAATTGNIRIYINNVLICDAFISTLSPAGSWTCDYQVIRSSLTNIRCQVTIRTCVAGTPAVVFCETVNVAFNANLAVNVQSRAFVSVGTNAINCSMGTMSGSKNI